METAQAARIIKSLAEGIDPHTGELFPEESPYNHPQTIRALFFALKALEGYDEKQKRERNQPENAGKAWTSAEDALLCQRFDAGIAIRKLAQDHKRSLGSIESRLVKLGKVESSSIKHAVST